MQHSWTSSCSNYLYPATDFSITGVYQTNRLTVHYAHTGNTEQIYRLRHCVVLELKHDITPFLDSDCENPMMIASQLQKLSGGRREESNYYFPVRIFQMRELDWLIYSPRAFKLVAASLHPEKDKLNNTGITCHSFLRVGSNSFLWNITPFFSTRKDLDDLDKWTQVIHGLPEDKSSIDKTKGLLDYYRTVPHHILLLYDARYLMDLIKEDPSLGALGAEVSATSDTVARLRDLLDKYEQSLPNVNHLPTMTEHRLSVLVNHMSFIPEEQRENFEATIRKFMKGSPHRVIFSTGDLLGQPHLRDCKKVPPSFCEDCWREKNTAMLRALNKSLQYMYNAGL
jgi:hypothetical protein